MQKSKIKEDMTGRKFGRLTVVSRGEDSISPDGKYHAMWICKCECGNTKTVEGHSLRRGRATSCGCYADECRARFVARVTKHGDTANGTMHRLYRIYRCIKTRCYYAGDINYKNYGGRGISVCNEWLASYDAFKFWALNNGYQDNLSIDRINVNGNYEPANCRWATNAEQHNNTRVNHFITYKGKTQTLTQWSEEFGINEETAFSRLARGWSVEDTFCKPIQGPHNKPDNVMVTYMGKTQDVAQWAAELHLRPGTIYYRLKIGWSIEDVLTRPVIIGGNHHVKK